MPGNVVGEKREKCCLGNVQLPDVILFVHCDTRHQWSGVEITNGEHSVSVVAMKSSSRA